MHKWSFVFETGFKKKKNKTDKKKKAAHECEWMEDSNPNKRLSASEVRRVLSFLRQQFRAGSLNLQNHKLPLLDDSTCIDIGEFCISFLLKTHLKKNTSATHELNEDTDEGA